LDQNLALGTWDVITTGQVAQEDHSAVKAKASSSKLTQRKKLTTPEFFISSERQLYFTHPNPSRIVLLEKLRITCLYSLSFNLCNIVVIGTSTPKLLNLSWIHNKPLPFPAIRFLQ
jgi:hypothetical protein